MATIIQEDRATPQYQGMTRARVIELANQRTNKIAIAKRLDLDAEFLGVLQRLCASHRWFWRQKSVGVPIVADQSEYDLASPALGADAPMIDVEQIVGIRLYLDGVLMGELQPVFEEGRQDEILEKTDRGQPSHYFIKPGQFNILRLSPIPDGDYRIRVRYWAMPNSTTDSQGDLIPLVPGYLHLALVDALEAEIYRSVIGEKSSEFLAAKAKYEERIQLATRVRDFASGRVKQWTSDEAAVRST